MELSQIAAVILAGGYGTRVKHLLPNLPKPMAPVAGKPFLEWILRYLQQQGIQQSLLATGYLGEVIEEHFRSQPVEEMEVVCYRETQPLGTAGGFLNAVRQAAISPQAWLVVNGDSLVVAKIEEMSAYFDDPSIDAVILGVSLDNASRYGSLITDERGKLVSFAEKREGSGIINGGVYLFRHNLLEKFPQSLALSFEYEVFPSLLAQNTYIKVQAIEAPFLDIGTPESLSQAEAFIAHYFPSLIDKC